jgi:hypothetical protein
MPSQWQTFPIEFGGGLISNMSALQQGLQKVGSATFLQNFEPSKEGGYKKVLGYTKFSSTILAGSGPVLGVKVLNETQVVAVRKNASNLSQYYVSSGAAWTSLGTAALLGGRVQSVSYNFNGNDKVFFVDGVNHPAVYNVTANTMSFTTISADLLGAERVALFKNSIFCAKGSFLYFSAPYLDTNFSSASGGGVINVGQTIVGLIVFRDQLIIFTKNKIRRLVGSSVADFQLVPITDDIGCLHGETIQEVGGDVMFMAADGLRLLSATERIGDFGLGVASFPINKDAISFVNSTEVFTSLVIREKAQYRVFAYSPSVNVDSSKGLIGTQFSDQGSANVNWATLSGFKVYAADSRYVAGGEFIVFANDTGYVYRMEFGSSRDGSTIEAKYRSPFMPIDDPQIRKTFYKLSLYTEVNGIFGVDVNLDFDIYEISNYNKKYGNTILLASSGAGVTTYGSTSTIFGTSTYGGVPDDVYNTNVVGSGKTVSLRIEDNSMNPSFSLDTAVLEYKVNGRK